MARKKTRPIFVFSGGERFAARDGGKRFAKDIVAVGKWIHPKDGCEIVFTPDRLANLVANTEKYQANGHKVPFPDGHDFSATATLGYWSGPFVIDGDRLWGVVEPADEEIARKLETGAIADVSAFIEFGVRDSKTGEVYDEVLTHVCATPYPVVTGQKEFLKLAREGGWYVPESRLADDEDVEAAQAAVDRLAEALSARSEILANPALPGGSFTECVRIMMTRRGLPEDNAKRICGRLKADSGEAMGRVDCVKLAEAFRSRT